MLARLSDVGAIVTWKLDRLARSLPHLLKLAERFEAAGVQLVTADGTVDTTSAAGKAFYAMRGTFAQFERDMVSERTKAMHAYLKSQDRVQSRTPFGFRVNDERRLERDPDRWPILVSMMERYAAGESLRQISMDYDVAHTVIRQYVRSRKALDSLVEDHPELVNTLRLRFSDQTFQPGPRSLLSGLARCSVCGTGLRVGRRDGQRIYECKQAGHVRVNADWLDDQVTQDIRKLLGKGTLAKKADPAPIENGAALERALRDLEDDLDAGLVSRERFVDRRGKLLERMQRTSTAAPRPRLETVPWDDLSSAEQRLALREILEAIEVQPIARGQSRRGRHPDRVLMVFK
jgi:DNA invertase Pin-like site-specific DNA recombinase